MHPAQIKFSGLYFNSLKINSFTLKVSLLVFLTFWIFGFLYPIITGQKNFLVLFILDRIYSVICHQENHKCFSIDGENFLVCSRCTGIYFGAFLTGIITLFSHLPELKLKVLMIASLPLFTDVLFVNIGVYHYSKLSALLSGIFFGSIVCLFLVAELENFFDKKIEQNE